MTCPKHRKGLGCGGVHGESGGLQRRWGHRSHPSSSGWWNGWRRRRRTKSWTRILRWPDNSTPTSTKVGWGGGQSSGTWRELRSLWSGWSACWTTDRLTVTSQASPTPRRTPRPCRRGAGTRSCPLAVVPRPRPRHPSPAPSAPARGRPGRGRLQVALVQPAVTRAKRSQQWSISSLSSRVGDPFRMTVTYLRAAVADAGEVLVEVNGGVGVVADAEEEDAAAKLPDAAHGTVEAVGRRNGVRGGDAPGVGPRRRRAWGLSLRRTPGRRRKASATTPMPMQGVLSGSKGWSSSSLSAGHDEGSAGPMAARRASMRPSGPPSMGPAFENDVCTCRVCPGCTPRRATAPPRPRR